jgi:PEP-CTERM/exosortase A-associated glycosyltransferase
VRILHVLDHSLPLQSGYAIRTISVLRSQRALGHETFQVTGPRHNVVPEASEQVGPWLFYRTPRTAGMDLSLLGELLIMQRLERRLEELVCELEPDLIYAHSPLTNGWPALRVARRHGVPVAYEIRALWEDAAVEHGSIAEGGPQYRTIRLLETMLMRRVDALAVICRGLRDEVLARGVPEAKVTIVPNIADPSLFSLERRLYPELQERLGLVGCTVLGFAGSFYRYEGLMLLIDAMPALIRRFPDLCLLLVGGGREEARLRERARHAGLGRHLVFTGRVPHDEVAAYYDLVDLFVYPRLPSRLTEIVTPLKPLEAMAAGRLVVASDVGGHRELVGHQRTGFLCQAGDLDSLVGCLSHVLGNPRDWGEVSTAARLFVERERTEATMTRRYQEMLDGLRPASMLATRTLQPLEHDARAR